MSMNVPEPCVLPPKGFLCTTSAAEHAKPRYDKDVWVKPTKQARNERPRSPERFNEVARSDLILPAYKERTDAWTDGDYHRFGAGPQGQMRGRFSGGPMDLVAFPRDMIPANAGGTMLGSYNPEKLECTACGGRRMRCKICEGKMLHKYWMKDNSASWTQWEMPRRPQVLTDLQAARVQLEERLRWMTAERRRVEGLLKPVEDKVEVLQAEHDHVEAVRNEAQLFLRKSGRDAARLQVNVETALDETRELWQMRHQVHLRSQELISGETEEEGPMIETGPDALRNLRNVCSDLQVRLRQLRTAARVKDRQDLSKRNAVTEALQAERERPDGHLRYTETSRQELSEDVHRLIVGVSVKDERARIRADIATLERQKAALQSVIIPSVQEAEDVEEEPAETDLIGRVTEFGGGTRARK